MIRVLFSLGLGIHCQIIKASFNFVLLFYRKWRTKRKNRDKKRHDSESKESFR